MPLPSNGPLSLQGHSKPGDAVLSKPKQAMIVRMSEEALEALEGFPNHPQMDFEFGANPKIHIGDVFFPMRSHKEPSPHELYLRAFTAAKPLVPLKLYANVTGKFTVERELGTKITDRVRERTLEAEKQRQDRQAIFLDAPPTLANTKKRKPQPPSSAVRKTQQHERTASSSTVTMSASPLPPTPPQKSDTNPLGPRIRMIRCISQQPRTEEEVVLLVGGQKCTSSYQQELTALLRDIAEPTETGKKGADKANRPWRLKAQTYLEVRPWDWPSLSDPERTKMARQARLAFQNMGIPQSDPAWDHARYRSRADGTTIQNGPSPAAAGPSRVDAATPTARPSAQSKADLAKRVISASDAKDKKTKPKPEPVSVKKETAKGAASALKNKDADTRNGRVPDDAASESRPATRRPGSGYKAKPDVRPPTTDGAPRTAPQTTASSEPRPTLKPRDRETSSSSSSIPLKPSPPTGHERKPSSTGSAVRGAATAKAAIDGLGDSERERDVRVPKRQLEDAADSETDGRRRREDNGRIPKKQKGPSGGASVDSERESSGKGKNKEIRIPKHTTGGMESDKERERERALEKGRERVRELERELLETRREKESLAQEKEGRGGSAPVAAKRKKVPRDFDDYDPGHQRKRKPGDGATSVNPSRAELDLSLPKKPEVTPSGSTLPRHKIKQEVPTTSSRQSLTVPSTSKGNSSSSSPNQPSRGDKSSAKTNGTTRVRRKSPIYTSSEDEGEVRKPEPAPATSLSSSRPLPTPAAARPNAKLNGPPQPQVAPSQTDHQALRARYRKRYREYLRVFTTMVEQKDMIEDLLNRGSATDGSDADPDADTELIDAEGLKKLGEKHAFLKQELAEIKAMWSGRDNDDD